MAQILTISAFVLFLISNVDPARILGVYPMPSISHQVVFRALTLELLKRGHELVVITPDPAFKNKQVPTNLTEIDTSESYKLLYEMWNNKDNAVYMKRGVIIDASTMSLMHKNMIDLCHSVFKAPAMKDFLANKNQKFDMVIMEGLDYAPLIFGEMFDAPVVLFSSSYGTASNYESVGAVARHPLLYPGMFRDSFGPNFLSRVYQIIEECGLWFADRVSEQMDNDFLKSMFGNVPSISELKKRIVLLLVNTHPIFDNNRPVTPATVYLGAAHKQPKKDLPQDLKSYLDNSKRGVVYVSLGTNVMPTLMHKELLNEFIRAFEKIPYDILWKFDGDSLEGVPKNVKMQKWFPQRDLLDHPNIKVFVMQGGLQSMDEAIDAELPLVGIPFLADQWYNTNKFKQLGIGVVIDTFTMVADDLVRAVNTVANDPSYKENMKKLKMIMQDQPQQPLERAVWWVEHVLRHKGSKHLLGAAAQISWSQYLMMDVLLPLVLIFIVLAYLVSALVIYIVRLILSKRSKKKVKKH